MKTSLTIVLLQGPAGPFFQNLEKALTARGHRVHRLVFDGGDLLFSNRQTRVFWTGQTPPET